MDRLLSPFHQSKLLNTLFLANIFVSFHYALIIYINSTYLSNFFSETQISALYIIGAVVNTVLLLNASRILEKMGIYRFIVYVIAVEFLSTIGMVASSGSTLVGLYFLLHSIAISLIYFNMDIFVESLCANESQTGGIRAAYLTMANITIVFAPAVVALLLINNVYWYVYIASAMFLLPFYYLVKKFKKVSVKAIQHIQIKETLAEYVKSKYLHNIFVSNFLLQLFYAFMVVYTPIYLNKYIGFSWSEIGLMFTIMLLPFILVELPVGEMEDSKYGEREFLTIGFVIMGLATIFISFITLKSFWIWTAVLFITRIGASLVEVSTESYFFKHVNQEKTDVISFFRVNRPLSFIVAPFLATLSLQFISFQYIFIVIGTCMIIGTHYSLALKDTK
ncbi:MAG: MFS transporter [Candidatus Zambryskibacteria bacterium]|nr:MFS transporter [Candidatus Zambryskibacteria bacterium]